LAYSMVSGEWGESDVAAGARNFPTKNCCGGETMTMWREMNGNATGRTAAVPKPSTRQPEDEIDYPADYGRPDYVRQSWPQGLAAAAARMCLWAVSAMWYLDIKSPSTTLPDLQSSDGQWTRAKGYDNAQFHWPWMLNRTQPGCRAGGNPPGKQEAKRVKAISHRCGHRPYAATRRYSLEGNGASKNTIRFGINNARTIQTTKRASSVTPPQVACGCFTTMMDGFLHVTTELQYASWRGRADKSTTAGGETLLQYAQLETRMVVNFRRTPENGRAINYAAILKKQACFFGVWWLYGVGFIAATQPLL